MVLFSDTKINDYSDIFCYVFLYFIRYGINIIFGGIYYGTLSYDDIGDYALRWYDFWGLIILLIVKYILQIVYAKGKPYDEKAEKRQIAQITQHKEIKKMKMFLDTIFRILPLDVMNLMTQCMDFFYEDYCPEDMKLDDNGISQYVKERLFTIEVDDIIKYQKESKSENVNLSVSTGGRGKERKRDNKKYTQLSTNGNDCIDYLDIMYVNDEFNYWLYRCSFYGFLLPLGLEDQMCGRMT